MNTISEHPGNTYLFEIASFLVMSAKESIDPFNEYYIPLRMLRAIVQLADFPQYVSELNTDPFLQQFKQEYEEVRTLVDEPNVFRDYMNTLVDKFVDEMQKRNKNR